MGRERRREGIESKQADDAQYEALLVLTWVGVEVIPTEERGCW